VREIALDTETTGLSALDGDRIIEIGCVELVDKKRTGVTFHTYVNPQREVSRGATEVSGLTYEFLKQHETFDRIYQKFLDFVGHDRLVIHNAQFDMAFINAELATVAVAPLEHSRVVDTLTMAREKYPGSPSSLDALCRRFSIDLTARSKHGALIDAVLLAEVYVSMSVEVLQNGIFRLAEVASCQIVATNRAFAHREYCPSDDELAVHEALLARIRKPIWERVVGGE
jgi:DNA polymerase-3 subunit epsilon